MVLHLAAVAEVAGLRPVSEAERGKAVLDLLGQCVFFHLMVEKAEIEEAGRGKAVLGLLGH